MTETEWLACQKTEALLTYVDGRTTERRFRLFACACYWRDRLLSHIRKEVELLHQTIENDELGVCRLFSSRGGDCRFFTRNIERFAEYILDVQHLHQHEDCDRERSRGDDSDHSEQTAHQPQSGDGQHGR